MKKKYIIITPSIINMGGAQMYVRNKVVYMQEKGWKVDLISVQSGTVYIPELRQFDCFIPELGFSYYLFSKRKREKIIERLINRALDDQYDEIVIESTCISECTWAEVLAERCNARHLAYLLQEDNTLTSETDQQFVKFKFDRRELASIADPSAYNMFASFSPISMQQSVECRLPAYCNNVEEDIHSEWIDIIKAKRYDYLIGCLSRLDKPFILPAVKDFIHFAESHPDKRMLLVMMGGAPEGSNSEKDIRKIVSQVENMELLVTGYLFPVSTQLLAMFDAFFSSAGSAWVCMRTGIPTVSYDCNDFKPIGLLGKTTKHSLFRDDTELPLSLCSLFDEILVTKNFSREASTHELNKPDFTSHDQFLKQMSKDKQYFSFGNPKLGASEKKLAFMLRLIGAKAYAKLGKIKRNYLRHK